MCLPVAKAKSAATCRPHNGGEAGGGGGGGGGGGVLCRLSLRGAREFKKEVKEPFSLDAEGEESVHAFTVPGNSSTTRPSPSRMCIQA